MNCYDSMPLWLAIPAFVLLCTLTVLTLVLVVGLIKGLFLGD